MNYERIIYAADSTQFAALSGDRNPIHSDPVAARRLPYGTTIVHGAHTLCASLDIWCRQQTTRFTLARLTADFRKPVFFDDLIQLSFSHQGDTIVVRARTNGNLVMKTQFTCVTSVREAACTISARPAVETAATWNRTNLLNITGSVPVMVDLPAASTLFPDFIRVFGADILALLLATSRVVGMKCPGSNSLFTALQLDFDPGSISADVLHFRASGFEPRFGILDVSISAHGVTGSAQCHLLQSLE